MVPRVMYAKPSFGRAISTLVLDAALAILLFPRMLIKGIPPLDAARQSFYFSAMSFTNTGFLPTSDGPTPYAQDYWFLSVLMLGVFLGVLRWFRDGRHLAAQRLEPSCWRHAHVRRWRLGLNSRGIKVTTLAILFLAAFAEARGNQEMKAFGRRIPSDVVRLGVSVVLWGATTVAVASIGILQIAGASLDFVLFEVISAFATAGLSTGLTAELPDSGVYVLAAGYRRQLFTRAEERPVVG